MEVAIGFRIIRLYDEDILRHLFFKVPRCYTVAYVMVLPIVVDAMMIMMNQKGY